MRLPAHPLTKGVARLGPRDAEFIYNEADGHLGHGIMLWLFDSPDPDADLTHEQATLWMTGRLGCDLMYTHRIRRAPLGLQHPYWEWAEDLDVADHVTVTAVLEPGWEGLGAHLDAVLTARMDLGRPPWEVHVFTGLRGLAGLSERMTAVAMKSHHSGVDGLGAVLLAQKLFSEKTFPGTTTTSAGPVLWARMLAESILGAPRGLLRLVSVIRGGGVAAREIDAATESGLWPRPHQERRPTRLNLNASGLATLQAVVFQADEFRQIRDAVPGATVNDVLLTVVGGALARYLAEVGEESADSVIAMVPRSMRKIEKWESANQLVVMSVDMHSGEEDPLKRMALISESAAGEKARTSHVSTRRLASITDSAPPLAQRLIIELRKFRAMDAEREGMWQTMVSNIPMSVDGLSLGAAPCVGVLGTQPPVDKDGVRHFLTVAAGGKLVLTVTADRAAIPDLAHYLDLIRESFDELKGATGV